ncbi:hypothetical protein MXB_4274 [Myxobolus squamalis]|nr:hypothetical protein MXB_4274 [Myxobolus squamalis]
MEGCETLKNLIITAGKLNIGIYFSNLSEETDEILSFYFSKFKIDIDIFQTTNEAMIQAKSTPRVIAC